MRHDRAMHEFLSHKENVDMRTDYDNPITEDVHNSISEDGSITTEVELKLSEIHENTASIYGVNSEYISYALSVRARAISMRFILDARKTVDGVESPYIQGLRQAFAKANATDDFNKLMDIARSIGQDEHGRSKYDLSDKQVKLIKQLEQKEEIIKTAELEKMIVQAEDLIHKHTTQQNIYLQANTHANKTIF